MNNDEKIRDLRKKISNEEYIYKRPKKKRPIQKKKKKSKINIVNIIFIAFLFYVLFTVIQQEQVLRGLDKEIEGKIQEKNELEEEVSVLQEDASKIDNPEAFLELVEKIARNEYKMVKPYETIYIDRNKNKNKFIKGIGY